MKKKKPKKANKDRDKKNKRVEESVARKVEQSE